jgi:hypothetical protein
MGDQVCKLGSAILAGQTVRGLAHFVRESVIDIDAIDDAHHGGFDRHILISDRRPGSLTVGTHHHLAGSRTQSVSNDDDVACWLFVEIVRVDDQKPDALEIGRLLRRPDCAYDSS